MPRYKEDPRKVIPCIMIKYIRSRTDVCVFLCASVFERKKKVKNPCLSNSRKISPLLLIVNMVLDIKPKNI